MIKLVQLTYCWICGEMTDDPIECEECDNITCPDCSTTRYENFSYWDGGVDIVTKCDVCDGSIYYTQKGRDLGFAKEA